ncbi:SNF2 helicase associated domain-containing protein [Haploplasma axanthum]|uniref:Uncharacterized conserved protein n=1 Tax=Haploplasma axanthum TaxID=29552 RepID=A0A449BBU7_HAPAX|nr:SNF2 helicase associated domain-containing protein [Haploplasma axanthum]VEU79915.1 Uncharacterized conserved protein [Haploplasma axanthum]
MNFSNFEKEINNTIIKRGKDYYKWGTVENIEHNQYNNTITANVLGSSDYYYDTEVQIHNNEIIDYNCSCPYEGVCKHVVALLYEIRGNHELNELVRGTSNNNILSNSSYYKKLETVTEQYMVTSTDFDNFYKTLIEYIESLKLPSTDVIKQIQIYFNFGQRNHANMENYHFLVYELFVKLKNIFSNLELEALINQYISTAYSLTNYRNTIIDKIVSQISDKEIKYLYYKALIMNDKLIYINRIQANDIKNVVGILKSNAVINGNYLLPFLNMNEDIQKQIVNYFKSNISDNEKYLASYNFWVNPDYHYYNILKKMLTYDEILKIAEKINIRKIRFSNFLFLTYELKMDLNLDAISFTYEDIVSNLDKIENGLKIKLIKKLRIEILNDHFRRTMTIDEMLILFDKLGGDFKNLLQNDFSLCFRLYDLKIFNDENMLYLKNQGLPEQLRNIFGLHKNRVSSIRDYRIIIIEDKDNFNSSVFIEYLTDFGYCDIYEFKIVNNQLSLKDDDIYFLSNFKEELSNQISDEKQKEYDLIVDRLYPKRQEKLEIKEKQETPLLIQQLSDQITNYDVPLLSEQVKIFPILALEFKDATNKRKIVRDGYKPIGAKVGFNKDYIVKNLGIFLNLIEEKQFFSYGKSLAFHHDLRQFDDRSKKLISIFEKSAGIIKYRNSDFLSMSDSKIDEIIDVCKGGYLYLVNEYNVVFSNSYFLYKVLENDYLVDISLEEKGFKLNLNDSLRSEIILELKSSDYLVDIDNKTIQKIHYINQKQRNITKFILDNPRINVEYAIDDFINKIIPFIDQEIKFSESLKEKVVNKTIRIDSYLDYDTKKDVIALKRKYYDNNIEVLKPNTEFQKVIIDKYNQTLETFGFEKDIIKNQELIIHFITANLDSLKKFGELYISETLKGMQVKKMEKAKISITLNSGLLKTHIEQKEFNEEELRKILKAYEKRRNIFI